MGACDRDTERLRPDEETTDNPFWPAISDYEYHTGRPDPRLGSPGFNLIEANKAADPARWARIVARRVVAQPEEGDH